MHVLIGAIGKAKSGPEDQLFHSYIARMPWQIELKELVEKKPLPEQKLKEKEGQLLLSVVPSGAKIIVLDERGQTPTSQQFSQKIKQWQDEGCSRLVFLIGGAAGHSDEVRKRADYMLSLGKMTWPHMLVRAMLAEQLYRVHTILTGHPYHRE